MFAGIIAAWEIEICKIFWRRGYWLTDSRKLKTTCAPKVNTRIPRSLLGGACWNRQGRLPRGEEWPAAKSTLGVASKSGRICSSPFGPDCLLFQTSRIFLDVFAFCSHANYSVGERRAGYNKGLLCKTILANAHNDHFRRENWVGLLLRAKSM